MPSNTSLNEKDEKGSPPSTLSQADNLPEFKQITITNVKKLGQISHIRYWQNVVGVALNCRGLGSLISTTLPRPTTSHSRYENWYKWSILVSKWLIKNVEEHFATPLQAVRPELVFADKTYITITTMNFAHEENYISHELTKLWNMRREQYHAIGAYVEAWRDQVILCNELNLGLSWYAGTKLMLGELKDEVPVICNFINHQIQDCEGNASLMDQDQFNAIANGILEMVYRGMWSDR